MVATIPQLQEAVRQNIAALKREITEIPSADVFNINPFRDRQAEVRSKLGKAAGSYTACLQGISILSQAYFSLGEREIGCKSALRLLAELRDTGTTNAEHKARLLAPKDAGDRPEQLWTEFHRVVSDLIELFEIEIKDRNEMTMELNVELLTNEIVYALNS